MKFIIALALFIAVATAQPFFRVANHVGTNVPNAVSFKQCGVAGTVWVHGKSTGNRFGYGADIPSEQAVAGLCSDGPVVSGSYVADDATIGMTAYWAGNYNNYEDGNRIGLAISGGELSYDLDNDCSAYTDAVGTGSTGGYKNYPSVNFFYGEDMRSSSQNWIVHTSAECPNYYATANVGFSGHCSGSSCKARVVFQTNGESFVGQWSVTLSQTGSESYGMNVAVSGYDIPSGASAPAIGIAISNCSGTTCNTVYTSNNIHSALTTSSHSCAGKRQPLASSA